MARSSCHAAPQQAQVSHTNSVRTELGTTLVPLAERKGASSPNLSLASAKARDNNRHSTRRLLVPTALWHEVEPDEVHLLTGAMPGYRQQILDAFES